MSYVGQTFVVLSLAEMVSMAPTSGGQHTYVSEFASIRWARPLSYASGWLSFISWQSIVTVHCRIVGEIVQAIIHLSHPTYAPANWATALLTVLTVVLVATFNIYAASHLTFVEGAFATFHIFALVPVCMTLWVMVTDKASFADVFVRFKDYSGGWSSKGLSVLVGQTPAIFVTSRCDAVAHMAQETERAGELVSSGMVWSFLLNMPLTFVMLITYAFNMGSVEAALESPYPFVHVFKEALPATAADTPFTIIIFLLMIMITITTMAATARQAYSFARDGGVPFSSWISYLSPTLGVPVNAIIFTSIFTTILSLVLTGTEEGFETMIALSASSLMASYAISIGCIALRRTRGEPLPRAKRPLGHAGFSVNCLALLYCCWAFFWPLWSANDHVTAGTFNWACILFVFFVGIAGFSWWGGARQKYDVSTSRVQNWLKDL